MAAFGLEQMGRVVKMLESRELRGQVRKVQYLFVSNLGRKGIFGKEVNFLAKATKWVGGRRKKAKTGPPLGHLDDSIAILNRIFELISLQHLQHLSLILEEISESPPLIPAILPNLISLSFFGSLQQESFNNSCPAPNLERLHIANFTHLGGDIHYRLPELMPKLSHLRISNINSTWNIGNLPTILRAYVTHDLSKLYNPMELAQGTNDTQFPLSLQTIEIGWRPFYESGAMWCGTPYLDYLQLIDQYRSLDAGQSREGRERRLVVHEAMERTRDISFSEKDDRVMFQRMWRDWQAGT